MLRIDDQYFQHPKVVRVGPLGMALHLAAISYSSRYLTNGRIPNAALSTLIDFGNVHPDFDPMSTDAYQVARWLVDAGLFEEVEPGHRGTDYIVHDYLDWQPSRDDVVKGREAARNRMRAKRDVGAEPGSQCVREKFAGASQGVREKFREPLPLPESGGVDPSSSVDLTPLPPTKSPRSAAAAADSRMNSSEPSACSDHRRDAASRTVIAQADDPDIQDQDEAWAVETAVGLCVRNGFSEAEVRDFIAEIRARGTKTSNLPRYCLRALQKRREEEPPAPKPPDIIPWQTRREGESEADWEQRLRETYARIDNPPPKPPPTPEQQEAAERAKAIMRQARDEANARIRAAKAPPPTAGA